MNTLDQENMDDRVELAVRTFRAERRLEQRGDYCDLLAIRRNAWGEASQRFQVESSARDLQEPEERLLLLYADDLIQNMGNDLNLVDREEQFFMGNRTLLSNTFEMRGRMAETILRHLEQMPEQWKSPVLDAAADMAHACADLVKVFNEKSTFLLQQDLTKRVSSPPSPLPSSTLQ